MLCKHCNQIKTLEEMFTTTNRKNGKIYICRVCIKCYYRRRTARTVAKRRIAGSNEWLNRRYHRLKRNAKKRGIEFSLTPDEFRDLYSQKSCYFCGEINIVRTVDRLDNTKGYIDGNCFLACYECNILKGTVTKSQKDRLLAIR
jgi:hypothetical protein